MRACSGALALVLLAACGLIDPEIGEFRQTAPPDGELTFELVRDQVFRPRCGCHIAADGVGVTRSGLNLDDYDAMMIGGHNSAGTAVVPGRPEDSVIIQKIGEDWPFGARMPRGGNPLDERSTQLISDWIAAGAPR